VGSVIYEGTNISEGRGTTTPFELIGHPMIEPHSFCYYVQKELQKAKCVGFKIRPAGFIPTFDKHKGKLCGGFQILVTDRNRFRPWRAFHVITRALSQKLKSHFVFNPPPYEYEYQKLPIDILNGTNRLREWTMASRSSLAQLLDIEREGQSDYRLLMREVALYKR
jgi:uncharacterized protein YbbC (DUF1343 family)